MYNPSRKTKTAFPGHDIELSKQWLREELKFRASHEILSSSTTDHFPGLVQKALETDTGAEDKVPHVGVIFRASREDASKEIKEIKEASKESKESKESSRELNRNAIFSVCITPGRDIHASIRVNGTSSAYNGTSSASGTSSAYNGTSSASGEGNFVFAGILDRFSETGHDLKDVTSTMPLFYEAWTLFRNESHSKSQNRTVSCPYERRQRVALNEDGALQHLDIYTQVMTLTSPLEPANSSHVRVQQTQVVHRGRVIHETVTMNNRKNGVPSLFTITTNVVPAGMEDIMVQNRSHPNQDLARAVSDGDMLESVTLLGFEHPLVVYNTVRNVSFKVDFAWRALNGLKEFAKHCKDIEGKNAGNKEAPGNTEAGRFAQSCVQRLKRDMDGMNHLKYLLQLPLTKVVLLPGEDTDLVAVVSHSVLP